MHRGWEAPNPNANHSINSCRIVIEAWCMHFSSSYQEWKREFPATVALHYWKGIAWNHFFFRYVPWCSKRLHSLLFKSLPHLVTEKLRVWLFCDVTPSGWVVLSKCPGLLAQQTHCHNCKTPVFSNTTVKHWDLPGSHEVRWRNGMGRLPSVGNYRILNVPQTPFSWC